MAVCQVGGGKRIRKIVGKKSFSNHPIAQACLKLLNKRLEKTSLSPGFLALLSLDPAILRLEEQIPVCLIHQVDTTGQARFRYLKSARRNKRRDSAF